MKLIKRMRPLLGTYVELAAAADLSEAAQEAAMQTAFKQIELIHDLLSFHQPESELSRLNRARGDWVECHPLSLKCFKLARALTRISQGRFNYTLGAAIINQGALPAQDFNKIYGPQLLASGHWDDLQIHQKLARLRRPVLLTLDGIAKGFAIDLAIASLQRSGVSAGWINAGGDIRVYGDLVLPISIRDHLGQDHPMGGLQNAAIATSTTLSTPEHPGVILGNNEPATTGTWTVISTSAWRADGLTKVAANAPANERQAELNRLGGRWIEIRTNETGFHPQHR